MKKLIMIVLLFIPFKLFCEPILEISIRPHDGPNSKETVFYSNSATDGFSLIIEQTISNSTWIPKFLSVKEKISEGDYYISFYEDDILIHRYKISNSKNMYDETNDKMFKSEIYSQICSLYIAYLENTISELKLQNNMNE